MDSCAHSGDRCAACVCVRHPHGRGCCTPQWHTRAGKGAQVGRWDEDHKICAAPLPSTHTGHAHAQGKCPREVGAAPDDRSISWARDRRRSGSDLILHPCTISRPPARRQPVVHLPVGGACANAGHSMCPNTETRALMHSKLRVVPARAADVPPTSSMTRPKCAMLTGRPGHARVCWERRMVKRERWEGKERS